MSIDSSFIISGINRIFCFKDYAMNISLITRGLNYLPLGIIKLLSGLGHMVIVKLAVFWDVTTCIKKNDTNINFQTDNIICVTCTYSCYVMLYTQQCLISTTIVAALQAINGPNC